MAQSGSGKVGFIIYFTERDAQLREIGPLALKSHSSSEGDSCDACLSSRGGWRGDQPLSLSLALLVGLDLPEGQTLISVGPKTVISRKEHLAVSQPQVMETNHTGPAPEGHQRELLTPAPADLGMLTPSLEGGEQGGRGSDI